MIESLKVIVSYRVTVSYFANYLSQSLSSGIAARQCWNEKFNTVVKLKKHDCFDAYYPRPFVPGKLRVCSAQSVARFHPGNTVVLLRVNQSYLWRVQHVHAREGKLY